MRVRASSIGFQRPWFELIQFNRAPFNTNRDYSACCEKVQIFRLRNYRDTVFQLVKHAQQWQ